MISRFNLDVKRMYYYDDKDKFNDNFKIKNQYNNEKNLEIKILEPEVLIVFNSSLKIKFSNKNQIKNLILYANQSISLIEGDVITIMENKNKLSKFYLYSLINVL
tara:strand:- start:7 stop:321 length:315 start_codon:yes stop_codon:yes gene_type:complete